MLESLNEFYGLRFDEALSGSLSRIRAHSQLTFQGDYLIYNMLFSPNAYTSEIVIGIFGYFLTRRETARSLDIKENLAVRCSLLIQKNIPRITG
jgi:hypothetical protein